MANPTAVAQPKHSSLFRTIAIVLLVLIVITGLVVLIIWLTVKPKKPVYSVENASIQGFSIAKNHLNATFNFVLNAYNPNNKVAIYYDKVEFSVSYDDQTLAAGTLDPFFQPHWNLNHLGEKLVAQNVTLSGKLANDLGLEKAAGEVELDVRMKARVRFKVGSWKSSPRKLKVLCSPVFVNYSSSKSSQKTSCDTHV